MSGVKDDLGRIAQGVRERFDAQKRVLSFTEYLELATEDPYAFTRDAARYLRDAVDHFGSYELERPGGRVRRWAIFDLAFERDRARTAAWPDRRSEHLVGHEEIQAEIHNALTHFAREGRANRLVLLHGPNGSAKSTLAACLMRGLEAYSELEVGALYRFSWIFPRGRDGKGIGFGAGDEAPRRGETYAHLPEERIELKLVSELREHPLHLLPREDRRAFVARIYERKGIRDAPPDWVWHGELGHKNRQIFEALLTAYRGDIDRVLAHVQIERFYVSRRYRMGAVTLGPQMAVDANERQVTAGRIHGSLPASLSALTLFETYGELVDASGGVIEYSDLLKRPLDAWKYLLLAIENGEVSLPLTNLPLNAVMIASSNELHLNAFKEHPEYNSFRGRIFLIRVPYLVDYRREQAIYDAQIVPQIRRPVAPHATFVAALWGVLTRLRRADVDRYDDRALGRLAEDLSPMEKAELYADGKVPTRFDSDDAKRVRAGLGTIRAEPSGGGTYEGLVGASPRELRDLLLAAAGDADASCFSPLTVLDRLEAFCRRDDYEFLQQTPDHGYHDHRGFVSQVREKWLDRVDAEVRVTSGLVEETRYLDLFARYVTQVSHAMKRERIFNPVTGKNEEPDVEFMQSVEQMLAVEDSDGFRGELLGAIAADSIDHPSGSVDYARIFPREIERLREAFFGERHKQVGELADDAIQLLDGAELGDAGRTERARGMLRALYDKHRYEPVTARLALGALVSARYADARS